MRAAIAVAALLMSCNSPGSASAPAGGSAAAEASPAAEESVVPSETPSTLPAPFTPEQIRDGMPLGSVRVFERSSPDGLHRERWMVTGHSPEHVTFAFQTLDETGAAAGEPRTRTSGWSELRDHAVFPPGSATRERVQLSGPVGPGEGWRYVVRSVEGGAVSTSTFEFADSLPGPPVSMVVRRGDVPVMSMTLVSTGP